MPRDREALTADEVETIKLWINQGADWESHWALSSRKPAVPEVENPSWVNPIDHFVLEKLEKELLDPSKAADKEILIRRLRLI